MDLLDDFERALPLIDRDEWDKESEQSNRYPRLCGICNSNGNSSEDGEGEENGEGGDEEGKEEDDEDTGDERDERDEGDEDQEDDTLGRNGRQNGRLKKKSKKFRPPLNRTKPTLAQMPHNVIRILRRAYPLATALIISNGVYEWTPDDPGPRVETYDEIIIRVWRKVNECLEVDVPYDDPYGKWQLAHVTGDNPEDSEEPRSRMYDVARLFYNKDRARTQPSVPILRPMKTWQGMIIHKKPVKKRDRLRAANRQQASSDDEQTTRAEEIERAEIGDRPEQQEEIAPSDPEQDFEDD
ncbi:unnamed protein product [Rhizoctonia solani]|uniref:Uncharacterized protein n=1 Tax=Rhizoctonia solani TaxID=456999 RepID=A0A8H3DTW5_9AGAM|nr:unnamed protein product [Rhizoctonia solani]